MPKISESRRAEVRGRILDAARHLVARRGVQGTSMSEIVLACGLSKGAIYGHFPSKAALMVALQERVIQTRMTDITAGFRTDESVRERILKLMRHLFESGTASDRERARLNLQFTTSALQSASMRAQVDARYDRVHRLFRDLFAEGQRSGEIRRDLEPDAFATTIIALLDGLRVDWAFTSQDRFGSERLFPTLEQLLFHGILDSAGSSPLRLSHPSGKRRGANGPRRRASSHGSTGLS